VFEERKTFKTISTLRFTAKADAAITCSSFNEDFPTPRTSTPLHIKVKYRPKVEMKFSQEKLKEGDNLKVECLMKAYPEKVTYKWFVDDIQENGISGNKFKMNKLTRMHHKSNIKCLVENQVGKSEVVKSLNIEFGPKMIIQPSSVNAKIGDKVTFNCKAVANPEPTYVWVKGTSSSSPEVVGAGEHLTVVASDEAETDYICKVVSLGFPMISTPPAQLVIEKDAGVLVEREPEVLEDIGIYNKEPRVLEDINDSEPTEAPMLPAVSETKGSKDNFTKVLHSFKKDYLLFQKRTQKFMKQSDNYFIDSNRFEKKYKTFKKKVKKFPKSFRKFLQTADIV
jgi:plastocyanin